MPPIKCAPYRLNFEGQYYRVYPDGSVGLALTIREAQEMGLSTVGEMLNYEKENLKKYTPDSPEAKKIRREASRLRWNRNTRERNQALKDLGLKKTPYGWE